MTISVFDVLLRLLCLHALHMVYYTCLDLLWQGVRWHHLHASVPLMEVACRYLFGLDVFIFGSLKEFSHEWVQFIILGFYFLFHLLVNFHRISFVKSQI